MCSSDLPTAALVPAALRHPASTAETAEAAGLRSRRLAAAGPASPAGFELSVTAVVPAECAWSVVETGHRQDQPPAAIARIYAQLRERLDETPVLLATRLRVIGACLAEAGISLADASQWAAAGTGEGCVVLQGATADIACTAVELSGVPGPVVVAILTGQRAATAPPTPIPAPAPAPRDAATNSARG